MSESRRLSEDIIKLCILPRLPTKTLLRFQCVSRSWHSLISRDPYFIYLHSRSIPSSILFMERQDHDGKFLGEFISQDLRLSGFPRLHFPIAEHVGILAASCNGLLCLIYGNETYIGNPILRDWMLLPRLLHHVNFMSIRRGCYGLAVDVEKSGVSYKLVVPEGIENDDDKSRMDGIFNVLSSRSGQWEVSKYKLDVTKCKWWPPARHATYVNGVLYWECPPWMLWFDTKDGSCGFFRFPPNPNKERWLRGAVGVCNGELTIIRVSKATIEIWSTADHQSSWTKIHSICRKTMVQQNPEVFELLRWELFSPMPFEGGNVVFFYVDGSLISYDMETGVAEMKLDVGYYPCLLSYKDCLTPLPSL